MSAWSVPWPVLIFIPFLLAFLDYYRNRKLWRATKVLVFAHYEWMPIFLFLAIGNFYDFPTDNLWLLWCIATCWIMLFKKPLAEKIFKLIEEE